MQEARKNENRLQRELAQLNEELVRLREVEKKVCPFFLDIVSSHFFVRFLLRPKGWEN